ncbi:uncharacterized protein LOC125237427 isoform X2 [Leguminivora glycinivorella]|uniref:uncharacterized protein LOC125237427 isoform X2 n=1 Tax=Leguminivora glycinivorella TaxID=1035111 RepID=UPI00200BD6E8|nr:uncharacterized protein LOC125237427 isoform X2 [Leguminivora glycinivorella]
MDDENNRCIICGNYLNDNITVVKERGLQRLFACSVTRADGKQNFFKNRTEVRVHSKCRNSYCNPKCMQAVLKRQRKAWQSMSALAGGFDFQNKCLICDKDASVLFEQRHALYPESNRAAVGRVETVETQNIILKACAREDDCWSQLVLLRIGQHNILEKHARFHYDCYNIFCEVSNPLEQDPQSGTTENAMTFIHDQGMDQDFNMTESSDFDVTEPSNLNMSESDFNMPESSDFSVKMEPEDTEENLEMEPVKQEPGMECQDTLNVSDPLRSPDCSKPVLPVTPVTKPTIRKQLLPTHCQICDLPLPITQVNITAKGLHTLKSFSERRMDCRFPPDFQGPVHIHKKCRKLYTNIRVLNKEAREAATSFSTAGTESGDNDDDDETEDYVDMEPDTSADLEASETLSESFEPEEMTVPTKSELLTQKLFGTPEVCGICHNALTKDKVIVTYKGYLSLQRSSDLRQDGKFPMGTEHESIQLPVHRYCRKLYTRERVIRQSICKRVQRQMNPNIPPPDGTRFDYLTQCLFCCGDASEAFVRACMRAKKKQHHVSLVKKPDMAGKLYRTSLDYPDSDFGEFRKRVKDKDLPALRARYHKLCFIKFLKPRKPVHPGAPGRRPTYNTADLEHLTNHIENNFQDSQFKFSDINSAMSRHTFCRKIEELYGSMVHCRNDFLIVQPAQEILKGKWHEERLQDEKSERLRIVRTAANIILEDCRSTLFDTQTYPSPSEFLDEVNSVIPESLKTFVETVVTKYQKDPEPLQSTVTALSHSIMTAARPRSFKSPLLLGIGSLIHQKYASKSLIDLLSSIGFCASYKDVRQLEMAMASKGVSRSRSEFTQFVFDCVESDKGPMLVGVECTTPTTDDTPVKILDKIQDLGKGEYKATLKKQHPRSNLVNVLIEDHRDDTAILPTRGDALWLFGKSEPSIDMPGWEYFISKMPPVKEHQVSEVRALPVIESPPTKDAIYTALKEAQKKSKGTSLVTFDQPMYQTAQKIVTNPSNLMLDVVLKLGGFDLIKSFLGAIGFIMSGSGLKELWCNLYAAEHIEKMMTGHAFARAIRAHFLTRSALFNIITKDFDLTPDEKLEIEGILEGCYIPDDNQKSYEEPLALTLELLEKRGPTAQLWVQYFRMTTLAAQFIEAERSANWDLHLSSIKKMLPYFHAAGYFEYAKSCSLYLQDMKALETKMNERELEKFTKKGYFAVRWTENFEWADRVVEKTMGLLKRPGGITNGTKVTDDFLANWLHASPGLCIVSELVQDFCKPPEMEPNRKDNEDSAKIQSWFEEHNPFAETGNLVALGTETIGQDLNCHEAEMVGKRIMEITIGQNYEEVHYDRSDCVRHLSVDKSIEIEDVNVPLEPDTILKRIDKTSKERNESFFEYELAPYPMSLFDDRGMSEANKSSLFDQFLPVEITDGDNRFHVLDGEFLLRKVTWKEGATVSNISYAYVEYVKKHYKNAIVMFGTNKASDTARRSKVKKTPIVEFQKDTVLTVDKDNFLANEKNKDRFIQYLVIDFTRSGIKIKLNSNDLHTNIVQAAIDNASTYDKTFIVSDNADLLLQMCIISNKDNVYFMKPSKTPTYFHVDSFSSNKIKLSMLFLHAVSGSDSTSSIFQKGKTQICSTLSKMNMKDIKNLMTIFANPTSDKNEIAEVGIDFIRRLYDVQNKYYDLNPLRYDIFSKSVTRSRYDLACVPPSNEAIRQHMYRTYHQIQKWLGHELPPTDWGWRLVENRLEPITFVAEVAPKELLNLISCRCYGVCSVNCVCKQVSLDCCVLCINCNGKSCHGLDLSLDSETGYNALLKSDAYGNPIDPFAVSKEESDDDEEEMVEEPEPVAPRPKRAKRETNVDDMSQQELEQVYIVE